MNGVGFEILARIPVPQLLQVIQPPPPPPPHTHTHTNTHTPSSDGLDQGHRCPLKESLDNKENSLLFIISKSNGPELLV